MTIEHMKARASSDPETASTRSKTAMPDDDHQPPEKTGSLVVFTKPKSAPTSEAAPFPKRARAAEKMALAMSLARVSGLRRDPEEGERPGRRRRPSQWIAVRPLTIVGVSPRPRAPRSPRIATDLPWLAPWKLCWECEIPILAKPNIAVPAQAIAPP